MSALAALILLAGIVGATAARPALCNVPYNASSSRDIAMFALGAARDDVEMRGLFACAYNSSKLFYDMFCGTQSSCTGVREYMECASTTVSTQALSSPLPVAVGLLSARSFNDALNCTEALPQAFTNLDGYVRPTNTVPLQLVTGENGFNDTCYMYTDSGLYSLLALSGKLRDKYTGVFGPEINGLKVRATICPYMWPAPLCNGADGVALCQQASVGNIGAFETSFGRTLIDAYHTPRTDTVTLVYEDTFNPPSLEGLKSSITIPPLSALSGNLDSYMGLVTTTYVIGWLDSAPTLMKTRAHIHLRCDAGISGEPVLSNVLPPQTIGLAQVRHVTIAHRCACVNASCPADDPAALKANQCSDYTDGVPDAYFYTAICLIALFIVVEKRSWRTDVLGGHIGVPIPFNFLEDRSHTRSTAMIFSAASVLLFIFVLDPPKSPTPYLQTFYTLVFSLRESLILFPLLLCNTCRLPWLGCLVGFFFSLSFAIYFAISLDCFATNGFNAATLAPSIVETVIAFVIVMYFLVNLVLEIRAHLGRGKHVKTPVALIGHAAQLKHLSFYEGHIKELLTPHYRRTIDSLPPGLSLSARVFYWVRQQLHSFWVRWILRRDSFRYGGRLVASVAICLVFLIGIFSVCIFLLEIVKAILTGILFSGSNASCRNTDMAAFVAQVQGGLGLGFGCRINELIIDSVVACFYTAIIAAAVVQLAALYQVSANYHSQLLRLYRGDTRFMPQVATPDSATVVLNAVRFTGFFVGYFLSGCFAIFGVVLLACLAVTLIVVLPLYGLYGTFIWRLLAQQVPILVIGLVFFFAQIFVVRFVFLQSPFQTDYSLRRRAIFHNYEFFFLLFDIISGIVSYIIRFVLFGLLAVVTFSRLDKSFFIQGFEWFDPGYRTYISCLLLDAYYSNPVLITFVRFLIERPNRIKNFEGLNKWTLDEEMPSAEDLTKKARSQRARTRWHLAYTLMHNRRLIDLRHHETTTGRSRWYVTAAPLAPAPDTPPQSDSGSHGEFYLGESNV